MNIDRLREIHKRLTALMLGDGSRGAVHNQLDNLEGAINELAARPQTHIKPDLVHAKFEWKRQDRQGGYCEPPYQRADGMRVCRLTTKAIWYADFPNRGFIRDTIGRKRTWKSTATAMAYLDRDYPIGGDWRFK